MTGTENETAVRTAYRVTWKRDSTDKSHTETCVVHTSQLRRPGDTKERDGILRQMLALRWLPIGQMQPENIVLLDVQPWCNCEPEPIRDCAYKQDGGKRFSLSASHGRPGFEVITDRHSNEVLGIVHNTLSVEFLTLVRSKYGHQ
ncbi:hypothetical protein AB0I98_35450 [Streptomyces sp. NPDC050211]|uniref:hypothetical protein n=1 Tax=Streptomyces sp. NPDC050211 TaxID=3154932 RepID=UPI003439CB90